MVYTCICFYLIEDTDAVEKKRAVTIDSPGNVKEPDETDVKTEQKRSKTVGDIEVECSVMVL